MAAARMPTASSKAQQRAMLTEDKPLQRAFAKTNREQQRQFAAPFLHVSQHNDAQARAAEQQAQSAEYLERAEVGVLHGVEGVQAVSRGREFEADVAERAAHERGNFGDVIRRHIEEEQAIASFQSGKFFDELVFVNDGGCFLEERNSGKRTNEAGL